jgi:phosphatidylglycerophosphatase A
MYATLLVAPATITAWILAFGLFRAFDIVKPWPIRELDHRLGGGLGIMLDDLVAALYAAILLALYRWLMT